MDCPKCGTDMESMGYGDMICPECKHTVYSESEEDFCRRLNIPYIKDEDSTGE
jgi:tRNA(Ile2) C34 agmatinyltransferase TiaS